MKISIKNKFKYIAILATVFLLSLSVFFVGCGKNKSETKVETNDRPADKQEEQIDPSNTAFSYALLKTIASGTEARLSVSFGGYDFYADVTLYFNYYDVYLKLVTDIKDNEVELNVQFTSNGKKVFFEGFDQKLVFDLNDIDEVIARLTALVGGEEERSESTVQISSLLSLLDGFDFTSIIPMLGDIKGTAVDGGGFVYDIAVSEDISVHIAVDKKGAFSEILLNGVEFEGKALTAVLSGFFVPPVKPAPLDSEEYKNMLDYLAVLENFCKEYDIPVGEAVEYFKNADLSAALELVKTTFDSKTLGADISVIIGDETVTADVSLDFSDGLKLKADVTAFGVKLTAYYEGGNIYVIKDNIAIKTDFAGITELVNIFTGGQTLSLPFEIAFKGVTVDADGIGVDLGGINASLNLEKLSFNVEVAGVEVSGALKEGEAVEVPKLEYSELSDITNIINKALALVKGGAIEVSGSIDVAGVTVDVNELAVDYASGIKAYGSVGLTAYGTAIAAEVTYVDGTLYLGVANYVNLKLGSAALEAIAAMIPMALDGDGLDIAGIVDMVKNITADANGVTIDLGFVTLSIKEEGDDLNLNVVSEEFGVDLTLGESDKVINAPAGDYIDISPEVVGLISEVDFGGVMNLATEILSGKTVALDLAATVAGQKITGSANVDFNEGIKAGATLSVFGQTAEAYFDGSTVYAILNDIAVQATLDDLKELLALFNVSVGESKVALKNIYADNGKLAVDLGMFKVNVDLKQLSADLAMSGIKADVSAIRAGEKVVIPEIEYDKLADVMSLIDKVYAETKEKEFAFNGSINAFGMNIKLENVFISDKGTGSVKENFDKGLLDIAGILTLTTKDNVSHKIDVTFVENVLYAKYFNLSDTSTNIKFDRESLDGVVDLIKANIGEIANLFITESEFESLNNMMGGFLAIGGDTGAIISKVLGMVEGLSLTENTVTLTVDMSGFGLASIDVALSLDGDNLKLGIVSDGIEADINLVSEFTAITAPEGTYIDCSHIDELLDGAFVTATKESKTFAIHGNASFNLSDKNETINITINAYVTYKKVREKNADGEEVEKMKVSLRLETEMLPEKVLGSYAGYSLISDIAGFRFGRTTMILDDDIFYIERSDIKFKSAYYKYEFNTTKKYLPVSECKGDVVTKLIMYVVGVRDSGILHDAITDTKSGAVDYAKLFLGYGYEDNTATHNLTLSMAELAHTTSLGNMTVGLTVADRYITKIGLDLDVLSSMKIKANLTHKPSETFTESFITAGLDRPTYEKFAA